ncbi:Hypothetical predicted protein [Octopus vulgaris]|uniref:Uncharacterized protein n=1 Tax=Octopus vulgaris TaxID=6645 RepID=A0AA36FPU4_OCTVU|nr:Hypothetical predicted protein [Octopus vulgaris]
MDQGGYPYPVEGRSEEPSAPTDGNGTANKGQGQDCTGPSRDQWSCVVPHGRRGRLVDLASMPARSVGDQVACRFPEVSVANHKTIRIAELQQPGSLLVAGTIAVASMYTMEAPSISSNMPIEVTSHKEKVPVVRQ